MGIHSEPGDSAPDAGDRLSRVTTCWTRIREEGPQWVLTRYRDLLLPYLKKTLGDAAEDRLQDLAVQLLQADYAKVQSLRGYLKTCVHNLIATHWRKKARNSRFVALPDGMEVEDQSPPLAGDDGERVTETPTFREAEQLFDDLWGNELVRRTLDHLQERETRTGRPLCTVFRRYLESWRREGRKLKSNELAAELTKAGLPQKPGNIRKLLLDARVMFCRRILGEAAETVDPPTTANLAKELEQLGLLEYCRQCIEKWQRPG